MRKILSFLLLVVAMTGCTAIEEFNKKLEDIHKSLPTYSGNITSSSSKKGQVINITTNTKGIGRFENAKITIIEDEYGYDLKLSGYYINTSKKYQNYVTIKADTADKDGDRVGSVLFIINDIRVGERKNLTKIELSSSVLPPGQYIVPSSWRIETF